MPDSEGKLTQSDMQKAQAWLVEKWKNRSCPFHGPTNWEIGQYVIGTVTFSTEGLKIGGPTYPMLVITCSTCGHAVFVNAIQVGIVPKYEPKEEKKNANQ
jgi:hypothetical protein